MQSPYQIALSDEEQAVLAARARSARGPYRDRVRAAIVLAAAAGQANAAIAAGLGICADTVRKWRRRFAEGRLAGLRDAPRSGRPPAFTAADRAGAVALACALPAGSGVPLSRWSGPDLARELSARCGITASASTVRRWLARDALKPWQHRSWISVRDPQFAAKAGRVLDLYAGIWDGRPLGPGDYVICADEKTSIQARCRCHPTLPPGKARAMRVEHDYDRRGALAYLAAWDVRRGQVTGQCEDTTGIAPFARLVAQVMTTEPYASADRVFWIVDNGSSHRGAASIQRMARAWPNAQLIHLPAHASWLDQAEIYFSVIQRKVLYRRQPWTRPVSGELAVPVMALGMDLEEDLRNHDANRTARRGARARSGTSTRLWTRCGESHAYDPEVAVRLICLFPPDRGTVVVALFAADKARLGDVFYDGAAARADPLIGQWKRETAQEEEEEE